MNICQDENNNVKCTKEDFHSGPHFGTGQDGTKYFWLPGSPIPPHELKKVQKY